LQGIVALKSRFYINMSKNLVNFSIMVSLFLVLSPVLENLDTGGKTLVIAVPVIGIFPSLMHFCALNQSILLQSVS